MTQKFCPACQRFKDESTMTKVKRGPVYAWRCQPCVTKTRVFDNKKEKRNEKSTDY